MSIIDHRTRTRYPIRIQVWKEKQFIQKSCIRYQKTLKFTSPRIIRISVRLRAVRIVRLLYSTARILMWEFFFSLGNGNSYLPHVEAPRSLSTNNYRKDFAQGALPHSIASSDSEISQSNTRPMSRTKQRSRCCETVNKNITEKHCTGFLVGTWEKWEVRNFT